MKILVIHSLVLLLVAHAGFANNPEIEVLRSKVFELNVDSRKAESLLQELDQLENYGSTVLAYKGTCKAHMAKVSSNPFTRLSHLRSANRDLSQAIASDEDNLELRFLRYALQVQIPRILGMSKHIKVDRKLIMEEFPYYSWSRVDPEIVQYICTFMIVEGDCTENEKALLNSFMANLD